MISGAFSHLRLRRLRVAALSLAIWGVVFFGGASAHGAHPKAKSQNLSRLHEQFRQSCMSPNSSYLSSVEDRLRTPDSMEELWGGLAGDQVSHSSASRWSAALREREQRSQQGLWSRDQDYLLQTRIASEGASALVADFKAAQQHRRSAELREAAERVQKQNPGAAVPLQVIAVAATVTTGQPVTAKVGDSSRIVARTDVPAKQAQLRVETPWVESDLRVIGREVLTGSEERYRLELSRGIPGLQAQGSVGYGGSTTLLTTAVKTQLSPSWLCVVDSSRPLDPNRTGGVGDDRIRFEYGIRF